MLRLIASDLLVEIGLRLPVNRAVNLIDDHIKNIKEKKILKNRLFDQNLHFKFKEIYGEFIKDEEVRWNRLYPDDSIN